MHFATGEHDVWNEYVCNTYLLYQLKSSQLTPSSWYSLSVLPFLYSLDSSNFFHELADGRV